MLTASSTGCLGDSEPAAEPLRAGSFNFDEGRVLSWIFALAFEANGIEVDTSNLEPGSTREILEPALEEGTVDFVPEYIGSLLEFVGGDAVPDAAVTFEDARSRLLERGVTLLPSAPAQNNNAFVVTRALSEELHLVRISDLASVAPEMTFGAPPECPRRALCAIGLRDVYGLTFGEFEPLDLDGRIAALEAGSVDAALLFSTDAAIAARNWVVLEDDRHLQPAENISLAIRTEVLERSPVDIEAIVAGISAKLTTPELRELNRQVQIDRVPAADVARGWLEAHGLIRAASGA